MDLAERIKSLSAELNDLDAKMASIEQTAIDAGRNLTAEEDVEYETHKAAHAAKLAEMDGAKKLLEQSKARSDAEARRKATPLPSRLPESCQGPLNESQTTAKPSKPQGGIPANVRRHSCRNFVGTVDGRDAEERAYRFGMFMLSAASSQLPHRYRGFDEANQFAKDQWAVHYSNDSNGSGFLVPTEFGNDLINLREQYGVCRRLFKNRPMSSEVRKDPRRTGGLTAYFVGDDQAITESSKGWDEVTLNAKELGAISRYSRNLSMDAVIAIGDDLAGEISYAFANKEDQCGFNGDGTSAYGHIQGVRSKLSGMLGLKSQGTGNTWSAIVLGDFDKVVGALPQYADTMMTAWVMHRTFYYEVVEKLIQASGGVPAMEVRNGQRAARPLFKGYPVEFSQVFPSTTATSSVVATLGDYTLGASFGDRQGVEVEFSDQASIGGVSLWERNQIGVRGVQRFDINVHDVGTASATGPIVGLTTGS